jgi:hypothetical protein
MAYLIIFEWKGDKIPFIPLESNKDEALTRIRVLKESGYKAWAIPFKREGDLEWLSSCGS